MKKVNYVKDTKAFWQERKRARQNLDKKLSSLPFSEKLVITEKMRENHGALHRAKQLT